MKYNKKQRHEIYKETLLNLEKERCICFALPDRVWSEMDVNDIISNRNILDWFPEIKKQEPIKKYRLNINFWFKPYSLAPRIKILKQAIKETE